MTIKPEKVALLRKKGMSFEEISSLFDVPIAEVKRAAGPQYSDASQKERARLRKIRAGRESRAPFITPPAPRVVNLMNDVGTYSQSPEGRAKIAEYEEKQKLPPETVDVAMLPSFTYQHFLKREKKIASGELLMLEGGVKENV